MWDSGRSPSADQAVRRLRRTAARARRRLPVDRADLGPRRTDRARSPPPATFETGLTDQDWHAEWIRRPATTPPSTTSTRTPARSSRSARHRSCGPGSTCRSTSSTSCRSTGSAPARARPTATPTRSTTRRSTSPGPPSRARANAIGVALQLAGRHQGPSRRQPGVIAAALGAPRRRHQRAHRDRRLVAGPEGQLAARGPSGTSKATRSTSSRTSTGADAPLGWDQPGFDDRGLGRRPPCSAPPASPPGPHLVSGAHPHRRAARPAPSRSPGSPTARSSPTSARCTPPCPTVTFHHGVAGRRIAMHAGYLLDPRTRRSGPRRARSPPTHGTQHTDLSYSYVQRGGARPSTPSTTSGSATSRSTTRARRSHPSDVVALTRHTAMPDQPPATFSSPDADRRRRVPARRALRAVHRPGAVPRHARPGRRGRGCGTGSTNPRPPWPRSASRTSPASPCSSSPSPRRATGPKARINKIYPTGLGAARHQRVHRDLPRVGLAVLAAHRGPHPARRGVPDRREPLRLRRSTPIDPSTGPRHQPSGDERLLRVPGRDPAQRARHRRLPRVPRDIAAALGRPADEVSADNAAGKPHLDRAPSTPASPVPTASTSTGSSPTAPRRARRPRTPTPRPSPTSVVPAEPAGDRVAAYIAASGMRTRRDRGRGARRAPARRPVPATSCTASPTATTPGWANILAQGAHVHLGGVEALRRRSATACPTAGARTCSSRSDEHSSASIRPGPGTRPST